MDNLIKDVEKYVSNLIINELPQDYLYHNLGHTKRVVKRTKQLIEGEKINEKDAAILILAAWFHDAGYTQMEKGHEKIGSEIATKYLKENKVDEEVISAISKLILSTTIGHEPTNLLEKIICDADCAHFANKDFVEISDLLRGEWELTQDRVFSDSDWVKENLKFLTENHKYHTQYAIENWQPGKSKNISSLLKKQKKLDLDLKRQKQKEAEFNFKKNKAFLPERGIETMFRVTLKNHITLSDIADTKANILLSVNAIIVSLVLSNLVSKLDNKSNDYLIWPTVIFVLFTVASMILSVLATRPNVTSGKFTKEDVANQKVNLLFFGNFHKMSLEDFEWAMGEMMQDRDYLYSSMKKDLYFLGKVLDKKYKILRTTYTVFIVGIVISVISFAIAFKFYSGV